MLEEDNQWGLEVSLYRGDQKIKSRLELARTREVEQKLTVNDLESGYGEKIEQKHG